MPRTAIRSLWVLNLFLLLLPPHLPAETAGGSECAGYDKDHTIRALGGPGALSRKPPEEWGPVPTVKADREEIQRQCGVLRKQLGKTHPKAPKTLRKEFEAILLAQKVPLPVQKGFWSAIKHCQGVELFDIGADDKLDWMYFRKNGQPTLMGGEADSLCFAPKEKAGPNEQLLPHPAFRITVKVPKSADSTDSGDSGDVQCPLKIEGGSHVEDPIILTPPPGATLMMTQPEEKTLPPGDRFVYPAPNSDDPSLVAKTTYSFKATVKDWKIEQVDAYEFVIPKACLNLAFGGSKTVETERERECTHTQSITLPPSCDPPCDPPSCDPPCEAQISIRYEKVKCHECFDVQISGDNPKVTIVDAEGQLAKISRCDGNSLDQPLTQSDRISIAKPGRYKLQGVAWKCCDPASATREEACNCSSTAQTTEPLKVKPQSWTARFFGLRLDPDDTVIRQSSIRPNGVSERSHLHLDGGGGAGAELEVHFTKRVGLAASVLSASLGSELFFDLDNDWESAEDDLSFLAFLIGPNFHLTSCRKFDVYLGPFVGWVDLGSTSYRVLGATQRRSFDADTVFGLQLGLDVPFGKKGWAAHFGARYMDLSVDLDGGPEVDPDSLAFQVGLAYRF